MTAERWRRVMDLFHASLERPPASREAFLSEACAGDSGLQAVIDRLLSAHERAGDFLETPAGAAEGRAGPPPVRQTLGQYKLGPRLGIGGMGEVYLADDTELRRTVAIKLMISPDRRAQERLRREAQHASGLNHPNICTIHHIGDAEGQAYIVMEYVEGCSLSEVIRSGGLPLPRFFSCSVQITDAVAHAHDRGIMHRDLKASNVMVGADDRVKVLDFGLARRVEGARVGDRPHTETSMWSGDGGAVVGTLSYMAPEVLRGQPADPRSDVWALGVLLHEMLTGERPFAGPTPFELTSAILSHDPRSLPRDIPQGLVAVVGRCLAKDPARRYPAARELKEALEAVSPGAVPLADDRTAPVGRSRWRWTGAGRRRRWAGAVVVAILVAAAGFWRTRARPAADAISGPRSIAVLPFQSFGGGAEDDYFLDGMTESIITDLAKTKDLLVIARNSVFQYKGQAVDVRRVGQELGVRYVLEGSVQRSGDRLRVNTQLIDTATGYHLWAERYDRAASDVFAVQDHISRNIAGALKVALHPGAAKRAAPTTNLEAYDAYLHGVYLTWQMNRASTVRAIGLLERAVMLDPHFALGHAALADGYRQLFHNHDAAKEWEEKAHVALQKALSIDPDLPEASFTRGSLAWTLSNGFPHEAAIADLQRAVAGNPNLGQAHRQLCNIYGHIGLLDEALAECDAARRIDPTATAVRGATLDAMLYQQRYDEVLALREKHPELATRPPVAIALMALGRDREARDLVEAALREQTRSSLMDAAYALLLARAGEAARAEQAIGRALELAKGLGHLHHIQHLVGCAYAAMGRKREALESLERASAEGFPCYPFFVNSPFLPSLRGDPRFDEWLSGVKRQWEHYQRVL